MKVLFYYRGIESLGVGYLMSYLKRAGHDVKLLFDPGLDDNLFLKLKFLKKFNQYDSLVRKAIEYKPDIMAFSIPTNLFHFFNEIIPVFKEKLKIPIIAGGPHPTALPEYVLNNSCIDMVCIGEGEAAFAELLYKMEHNEDIYDTKNIWFKKNGSIIKNEIRELITDLDSLPFPDKAAFHQYGCFHDNLEIITGRGCPFQCSFCNIHLQRRLAGNKNFVRRRSVKNVIEELKYNLSRYDIKYISFHDDTFTTDYNWIREFAEEYKKEIGLPFYCFAYPTTVTEEIIAELKKANCMQIFMGLDCGNEKLRMSLIKRPMSNNLILKSAGIIKKAGIQLQISTIFGFPGESDKNMWETFNLAVSAGPDMISGYIFYPFPETDLYKYAVENNFLSEQGIEKIRCGDGGYHHDSVMKHDHKNLAVTMSKIIPLYNRIPVLRPLLKLVINMRLSVLAGLLYIISIPVTFPFLGIEGIKITLKMIISSLKLKDKPV